MGEVAVPNKALHGTSNRGALFHFSGFTKVTATHFAAGYE